GGCVEGDIWFAAKELMHSRGRPVYRDYFLNEEIAARDGLVCGGTMFFFIEPVWEPQTFQPFAREALEAYEGGAPVAVATVMKPTPGQENLGAKLLVRHDGSTFGSLGNPELDALVREAARRVSSVGNNEYVVAQDGTEVFVEGFTTPPTLVLMGGGHIAKSTAPLAKMLGFRIYVIDDRPQFANPERFPEAEGTIVADFVQGLQQVPVNVNTFIVVATRGHRFDDLALEAAARTPARYVGLVGSRRKTILIHRQLLQKGIPLERVKDIHAPVGLDIGALTPEEIAVSIMAEIVMARMGGTGRPMKLDERQLARVVEMAGIPIPTH
ncbi:MAG: XdhC family protein, partial [Dehalococcoidia bacterium]